METDALKDLDSVDKALKYMAKHEIRGRNSTTALVVARALERGVTVSRDRRGRARLHAMDKSFLFSSGVTSFNSKLARRCAQQKEVTSRLLRARGVPAPENAYFEADDLARAWAWAEPVLPVVVKPGNASQGRRVYMHISDHQTFSKAYREVTARFGGALVERQIKGTEHRVLVIDGEIVAVTRRLPANVVGDGVSTVLELIQEKNKRRVDGRNPVHRMIRVDEFVEND